MYFTRSKGKFFSNFGPPFACRFASTVEALQYVRQHQEEHNARGFETIFGESSGAGENGHDDSQEPQISNRNEEQPLNNAGAILLAGVQQADAHQTENSYPVSPPRVELAGEHGPRMMNVSLVPSTNQTSPNLTSLHLRALS